MSLRSQVLAQVLGSPGNRIKMGTVIEALATQAKLDEISATLTSMLLDGEVILTEDRHLLMGQAGLGR
jgi:hypothetical protein